MNLNLVTTASPDFAEHARALVSTYRGHGRGSASVVWFGGPPPDDLGADFVVEVPRLCEHAHNPRFYFFKTFALKWGLGLGEPFLYLDARCRILSRPAEIELAVQEKSRFLLCCPPGHPDYPLQSCTTRRCFEELGCWQERYRFAPCYWAAIQAWRPTAENMVFVDEFLERMKNPHVAGPSNWLKLEDPENPECWCHRNDQSVLNILIEEHGWHQPYDATLWAKYGDRDTLRTPACETTAQIILGRA